MISLIVITIILAVLVVVVRVISRYIKELEGSWESTNRTRKNRLRNNETWVIPCRIKISEYVILIINLKDYSIKVEKL